MSADPTALLRHLAPGVATRPLAAFGSGWEHQVWAVGRDLVLRVDVSADVVARRAAVERDVRLLHLVGQHVTVPTGEVVAADPDRGAVLLRRVGGRSLADGARPAAGFADDLARLLQELSSVSEATAREVAGPPRSSPASWLSETHRAYQRVAGQFPSGARNAVEEWLAGAAPREAEPARLCHNDLGDEHLFLNEHGRLCGVIDWTDAVAGDPARDLALLWFDLGVDAVDEVLDRAGWAGDSGLRGKAQWFAVRAGVAGICHRLERGLGGVEEQVPRLAAVLSDG